MHAYPHEMGTYMISKIFLMPEKGAEDERFTLWIDVIEKSFFL